MSHSLNHLKVNYLYEKSPLVHAAWQYVTRQSQISDWRFKSSGLQYLKFQRTIASSSVGSSDPGCLTLQTKVFRELWPKQHNWYLPYSSFKKLPLHCSFACRCCPFELLFSPCTTGVQQPTQQHTNCRRQVTVAPNTFRYSASNLLHVTFLAS
jgi:hypothetical protein